MKINELKRLSLKLLENNSDVDSPHLEFSILLENELSISQVDALINPDREINVFDANRVLSSIKRRVDHTPLSYITNKREFYGLEFYVTEDTLIPRPDTEVLVETALSFLKDKESPKVLDLCTGTGCVGLSIKRSKNVSLTLSDISKEALAVARINSQSLINNDATLILSDLFTNINEKYDLIVSNPPYLTQEWYDEVSDEVKREPKSALLGFGDDGLEIIKRIITSASNCLNINGMLALECDFRQAKLCAKMMEENRFSDVKIIKDLSLKDRVVRGIYAL